ncbi:hypothetical protein NPIL_28331 [Nephila pilipes]|uniref:Uncharacterized protein n=1 Tax=Nephila pilipes TaxID=299642 RepID=A0A8X6TD16_NEPPI|nr:hypothetical protein NPIL_28331 [Nephila pilipes]
MSESELGINADFTLSIKIVEGFPLLLTLKSLSLRFNTKNGSSQGAYSGQRIESLLTNACVHVLNSLSTNTACVACETVWFKFLQEMKLGGLGKAGSLSA